MRGLSFAIATVIIMVGFAFPPGSAWGYAQGDPVNVKPYIPVKDGAVPASKFHVYCYNIFTGVTQDCEHELQLRESSLGEDDPAGHNHISVTKRPVGNLRGGDCIPGCEQLKFNSYEFMPPVYVDYLAPEVSGDYVVDWSYKLWWMQSPVYVPSAFKFSVKIPLNPMPVDYPHYRLTGRTPIHPDNHYGEDALIGRLIFMSDDYYEYTGERGTAVTIGINDMSLPWGGMFDLNGNWWVEDTTGNGHVAHREGMSVDIDHFDQYKNRTIKEKYLDDVGVYYDCARLEKNIGLIHYECK